MAKLRFQISMSVDGFVAGPNPTAEEPLGKHGEALHEWVFKLKAWREPHGREGGETNASSEVLQEAIDSTGALIMGRQMFGGGPGPWGDDPWEGWWGDDPPFHKDVFVLTHHEREPLTLSATTFHFVTDGIESALAQATKAAGDKDVGIAGGANVFQQYLAAELVDEIVLSISPILLGSGPRLFDNVDGVEDKLRPTRVIDTPDVTHLMYSIER